MNLVIRPERVDDYAGVREINERAFGREHEGRLVERLRKTERFVPELSLVACSGEIIVGHVLFYPVHVTRGNRRHTSLALAPLAVHPDYRRRGIGARLVQEGLAAARRLGYDSVIVVGHPEYYPMFGFQSASTWNISPPFDVPDKAFLALELRPDALKDVDGSVEYPEEFNEV